MTNRRAIIVTLILLIGLSIVSGAKPKIVVLANSIDYEMAQEFFGFLKNKGIETTYVTPAEFEQYKTEKFIVILGGPDAYEGVGEIVQDVLSEKQENSIREKGARKKYTVTNKWAKGQRVTVIAGSDRNQTKKSHEENKDNVSKEAEEEEEVPETTTPPTTTPPPTNTTPPTTTPPPTVDAQTLFETKCSVCHNLTRPMSKNKSRSDWEITVKRMQDTNGARTVAGLTDEDAEIIIDYLAANYGL